MQKKGAGYHDAALSSTSFSLADVVDRPPKKQLDPEDDVYVFATKPVDLGDGMPIPAHQFVVVKWKRVRTLQSVARQNGAIVNVMPYGWTPKELNI